MSEQKLSFWNHLDELRGVLLRSLGVWVAASVAMFCMKVPLFDILFAPAQPDFPLYRWFCRLSELTGWEILCLPEADIQFLNIDLTAQFMTHLQVAMVAGLIVALPFIIYWLYGFIAPALYEKEKRYSAIIIISTILLFVSGLALNYFLIFPLSFRFLGTYQVSSLVVNQVSLSSYISLFLVLSLLMGIMFEIPVLTWLLSCMGILSFYLDSSCHSRKNVGLFILSFPVK